MNKPYYSVFYLVTAGDSSHFINCYEDETTEHGGWASSDGRNKRHVPEPGIGGSGLSYQQRHLANGQVKAKRIKRCAANKLLKEWGYDFRFSK